MDEDQSSVGPRWSKWVNRFDNFMAALNITDDTRRKALILHYGGERVFEIFETLDSNARVVTPATATTAAVNETCYEAARRALSDHFTPRVNTDFEMFTFRQSRQQDGESFEAFHTRLQRLAKNCGFTDKDREIKAQLTIGCTSTELRRKILEKPAMTLDAVLNKARAIEAAATQASKMEQETEQTALAMKHNKPTRNFSKRQDEDDHHETFRQSQQPIDRTNCSFCGGRFHQRLASCPARFHQCSRCLNIHHFEEFCRSPKRERPSRSNQLNSGILKQQNSSYHSAKRKESTNVTIAENSDSESDDEHSFHISTKSLQAARFEVAVNNIKISVIADSGSTVTLLDRNAYRSLGKPKLLPTSVKIYTYNSKEPLPLQGELQVNISHGNSNTVAGTVYVCRGDGGNLLSGEMATKLGLLYMANAVTIPKLFSGKQKNYSTQPHIKKAEQHLNFVTASPIPKSMTTSETQEPSEAHPEIQTDITAVTSTHFKGLEQPIASTDRTTKKKHSESSKSKELQAKATQLAYRNRQGMSKTKGPFKRRTWFPNITKEHFLLSYSATPHTITRTNGSKIAASSKDKPDTQPVAFSTPHNCNAPVASKSEAVRATTLSTLQFSYHQPPPNAEQPLPPDGDDCHKWPEADVQNPAPHENEPPNADHLPPLPSDDEDDDQQIPVTPERRGPRPKRRPNSPHEGGKGTQSKKQDDDQQI
jgi:hypothetical protein